MEEASQLVLNLEAASSLYSSETGHDALSPAVLKTDSVVQRLVKGISTLHQAAGFVEQSTHPTSVDRVPAPRPEPCPHQLSALINASLCRYRKDPAAFNATLYARVSSASRADAPASTVKTYGPHQQDFLAMCHFLHGSDPDAELVTLPKVPVTTRTTMHVIT